MILTIICSVSELLSESLFSIIILAGVTSGLAGTGDGLAGAADGLGGAAEGLVGATDGLGGLSGGVSWLTGFLLGLLTKNKLSLVKSTLFYTNYRKYTKNNRDQL